MVAPLVSTSAGWGTPSPEASSWAGPGRLGEVDPGGPGGTAGQVREFPVTWRVNLRHSAGGWSRLGPSLHTAHSDPSSSRCSGWGGGVSSNPGGRTRDRAHSQCPHTCHFSSPPESSRGNFPARLKQPWPSTWTGPSRTLGANQRGPSSPTQDSEDPGQTATCTADPPPMGTVQPCAEAWQVGGLRVLSGSTFLLAWGQ